MDAVENLPLTLLATERRTDEIVADQGDCVWIWMVSQSSGGSVCCSEWGRGGSQLYVHNHLQPVNRRDVMATLSSGGCEC